MFRFIHTQYKLNNDGESVLQKASGMRKKNIRTNLTHDSIDENCQIFCFENKSLLFI